MNNTKIFFLIIGLLILGTISAVLLQSNSTPSGPGKYDELAICLKDKGAVFYGAFWCSHCQAQKKLFGSSAKLLPYVECSTADASGQLQICKDKKIAGYPSWELADGTFISNEDTAGVSLKTLAEKTGCVLPQ